MAFFFRTKQRLLDLPPRNVGFVLKKEPIFILKYCLTILLCLHRNDLTSLYTYFIVNHDFLVKTPHPVNNPDIKHIIKEFQIWDKCVLTLWFLTRLEWFGLHLQHCTSVVYNYIYLFFFIYTYLLLLMFLTIRFLLITSVINWSVIISN